MNISRPNFKNRFPSWTNRDRTMSAIRRQHRRCLEPMAESALMGASAPPSVLPPHRAHQCCHPPRPRLSRAYHRCTFRYVGAKQPSSL
ncbi:unnamed protein product, partial [Nesidiocoris tenuis]